MMIENFFDDIGNIKNDILNLEVSKQYFEYIELIKNNKELQNFFKAKKYYKQKMVYNEYKENDAKYKKYKTKYDEYSTLINNHPLIINFKNIKKEIILLTDEIKDILVL